MIKSDALTRAWVVLIALSGLSAVVSTMMDRGFDTRIMGSVVLALALMKARIILSRYLGLADAPSWRRGFNLTLTLFCLLLLGLYLFPQL
ncbi:cytochrome c oxidase subunit IV [Litoreibacter meonggei]|uniref:Cytochrome c oxidase subunit IV n=1 Tax=Litoreibacter meonggei TaxID=1049199 RepID=A0A497WUA2_9RHOB|nr:cytochrome C oxidase subunit IV family protein [Litoreibacter meonggei]RLJ59367.1 cytochrome c oxidase subunit IV [Litoreibacter meonggei]